MSLPCSSDDELGIDQAVFFPMKVRKKVVHNQVEKRRKDKINGWIIQIGELLPENESKKQSKNGILERAVDYILQLKETNKKLMLGQCDEVQAETVNRYEKRLKELEQQNKSYTRLLRKAGITPITPMEEELWKPKNGKYPKNLSVEQVSALQKSLNQNGFLRKRKDSEGSPVEANENANTTNCPVSNENSINHSTVSKTINTSGQTKTLKSNNSNDNNKTNSCKLANSVCVPGVSMNNMVLTQALPTEPLMSTTQNISLVQRGCNGATDNLHVESTMTSSLVGTSEVNAIVNTQAQPLIVINDQSIPLVQNMLTFQSKPIVLGNESSLPVIPQQFANGASTIEFLNAANNASICSNIQKSNASTVRVSVGQNCPSSVQSNASLPVVINGAQISSNCATLVPGTGSMSSNLLLRPQESSATTILNSFCGSQDPSQILQHSGVMPAHASKTTVMGVPNNGPTLTNSVLPNIGQTMAFNQAGQVITFGPGTILTTPTAAGAIQTQQSWPSALLLPNGQIIPVVSQPSVVYSSNPSPLSGGLIVTPNVNPQTQIQNGSVAATVSPPKTATSVSAAAQIGTNTSTSVIGTVINQVSSNSNNCQKGGVEKNQSPSKGSTAQTLGKVNGKIFKSNSAKPTPSNPKPHVKTAAPKKRSTSSAKVANSKDKTNSTKTTVAATPNPVTSKNDGVSKTLADKNKVSNKPEIEKNAPAASVPNGMETESTINNEKNASSILNSPRNEIAESTDLLAKATKSIFSSTRVETSSVRQELHSKTAENGLASSFNGVAQKSPTNLNNTHHPVTRVDQNKETALINSDKKDNGARNKANGNVDSKVSKKQNEKRCNDPKAVDESEPSSKKLKNAPKNPHSGKEKAQSGMTYSSCKSQNAKNDTNVITSNLETNAEIITQPNNVAVNNQNSEFSSTTDIANQTIDTNQNLAQNIIQDTCASNMDLGAYVTSTESCVRDIILGSLGEESDTPSTINNVNCNNNNTGLQYLSLSPPDHFNHEISAKENSHNQNSFNRNIPIPEINSSNSTVNYAANPANQVQESFMGQSECNKPDSLMNSQNMNKIEKKMANSNESSMLLHCNSGNSLNNQASLSNLNLNPNGSSGSLPVKQSKGLTHLSVTNSFLTNQVSTLPVISSQACLNSTASIYSRCSQNSMQHVDSQNSVYATSQISQSILNEANDNILTNLAPTNSCYSNSMNKEHGAHQSTNMTAMIPVSQNPSSMGQIPPSSMNHGLERNTSPKNSIRPISSSAYAGMSIYGDTTSHNQTRFPNRSIPPPMPIGNAHTLSNYSAEALIGHQNPSNTTNTPNLSFNSPQENHCSQNIAIPQITPTCSQATNRPLLSYSAESLLQNQPHSERKKEASRHTGNENSYTQHFHHLRSPTRTNSTLMGQNTTFSQPMFSACSTFSSTSNSVTSVENNSVCQISGSNGDPATIQSGNYGSSNQQFGNHFSSGSFLMRPLPPPPPHMPDVSHATHRTTTQPSFTIGCAINSNANEFSQKHPTDSGGAISATRNMNANQNVSTEHAPQIQHSQHHHQRSGCLFPSSSPQSIHPGAMLPMPDSHFSLLSSSSQNNQTTHGSSKNDILSISNHHYPTQPQTQNHIVNNFLPGQFVQGMTGSHQNLNLDGSATNGGSNQLSRIMPSDSNQSYLDGGKKDNRNVGSNNIARNHAGLNHSKTPNKSGKNASKRKPSSEGHIITPPISLGSYEKSHNMSYFSVPELSSHSDLQSCSINRFFPGCQRTNVGPPSANHQQNRGSTFSHSVPQTGIHVSAAPDISSNSPYNPLYRPQSQGSLNLNFQAPSFAMNPLQRVPPNLGCPTTSSSSGILSCQLTPNNGNNSACATASHHVPNFNLSNIFPDISASTSTESLTGTLNPIKFHPPNSIIAHPPNHPPTAPLGSQGSVDLGSLSQVPNHQNRNGVTRPPPLYHNRAAHPTPPVIHNSFNGILGTGSHAFDRGSSQMVMGMPNNHNPSNAPPHFGHPTTHPPPFANVLPSLNFPVHDTH